MCKCAHFPLLQEGQRSALKHTKFHNKSGSRHLKSEFSFRPLHNLTNVPFKTKGTPLKQPRVKSAKMRETLIDWSFSTCFFFQLSNRLNLLPSLCHHFSFLMRKLKGDGGFFFCCRTFFCGCS